MSGWKCRRCGWEFEHPRRVPNGGGDRGEEDAVCPRCGSGWYDEADVCPVCGRTLFYERFAPGGVCRDCLEQKTGEVAEVLAYVRGRGLQEEFFVRAVFGGDKRLLYSALQEAFLRWPIERQQRFAALFANEDRADYAAWLRQREEGG